jgi:hypothetical protein
MEFPVGSFPETSMEERPIGSRGSKTVTDDGAKYLERHGSWPRQGIYDPNPLPKIPPGTTFSPEQKRQAWNLMRPDKQ